MARVASLLRLFTWSWRTRVIVWATGASFITFGPIAQASWDLHRANVAFGLGYSEVGALHGSIALASAGMHDAVEHIAHYRSRRSPAVDQVLPEGAGGTHFFEHLGKDLGLAYSGAAAIALAVTVDEQWWPETTELHERAHLVNAFLPNQVGRLMARMPAAAREEYAATNQAEHFAEMAAKAWEIVEPPDGFCIDGMPADRLRAAEALVPGTSGFVALYLRQPGLGATEGRQELMTLAAQLTEPQRAEWDELWRSVEARRLPDGTFERWRHLTVRASLEARRDEARSSDNWIGRMAAYTFAPSLAILRLAGR